MRTFQRGIVVGAGACQTTAMTHHRHAPAERALIEAVAGKSKSGLGRLLATDGAHVLLANFADESRASPSIRLCPLRSTLRS